ncbi:sulfurtransferase TusA family protein [Venenivibrio stagnispumantis]|uniref:TusA-related sulfurtransferase n=1 Tax=Venenivibrio stagnispumantis TaxID=407998 RepID=A0AA46ACI8_9AQUI|nr:sulfurtransferase TusA family protein [Venenivibrio stagnispumantis]MCW4572724.1 sulfurtransferase TusA family protein [Venenivibrio stagnispumantis]SMP00202.1 TusA-related sulfurtransferase [Venenivibrio stagnispumantis]
MKEVDTRGLFCPLPLTIVSKNLKEIPVGERLKILADDKAFKKDIEIWAYETGNKLLEFKEENGYYVAIIERGKGFKGENIIDKIKFISLGVKLHFIKHLLDLFPPKKPKYLLTFVSVAEGLRADKWLKEEKNVNNKYILLPVPKEIYPHCGLVFGFLNKEDAINIYNLLKENKFAVEDIHIVDKDKKYPVLKI